MLRVEALRFTYPGSTAETLKGLDFHIDQGEVFGFLGPNGAGKSTTQNLLIGLLRGYRGSAQAMGREIREWGPDYYERIGVSFEVPNHFSKLSALENLRYFAALYAGTTEDPRALLAAVGLEASADMPVGQFSKGMKSRLTFARSLLPRPRLLFLDEPTSGLDPANARNVKEIVRQRRDAGTTVFLTTHNMVDAEELCDRVALMVEGELRAIDAPLALQLRHGARSVRVELETEGEAGGRVEAHDFPLDGLGENRDFLALLESGRRIRTIHSQEPSLEQVFLEVTGRRLA